MSERKLLCCEYEEMRDTDSVWGEEKVGVDAGRGMEGSQGAV